MEQERVITPTFRVSFPYVFKPNEFNGKEKFSITMLFNEQEDLSKLKKMCVDVAKEKWGKVPEGCKFPFREGNDKDLDKYPSFENTKYCQAQTMFQPGVVDSALQPIIDESEFYAGCYARASITAFAWVYAGKKGISFNLLNVQKVKEGNKLGSRKSAEDEFQVVETDGNIDLEKDEEYDEYDI